MKPTLAAKTRIAIGTRKAHSVVLPSASFLLGQSKFGYGKIGVIGAIERKGNVVARVIGSQDAPTLAGFVRKVVDKKTSGWS